MIKQITAQVDFQVLAKLLNDSFATVACYFELTKENSPKNNAFITAEELACQLNENREFYYYEYKSEIVGFIAIEKSKTNANTFYIEKVAVHPAFRHKSIGKQLMNFSIKRIKVLGGKRISIGLINANIVLKNGIKNRDLMNMK